MSEQTTVDEHTPVGSLLRWEATKDDEAAPFSKGVASDLPDLAHALANDISQVGVEGFVPTPAAISKIVSLTIINIKAEFSLKTTPGVSVIVEQIDFTDVID